MPYDGVPRILLVDDEDMLRRVMQRMLEDRGFTVLTAGDGLEAWKILQEGAGHIDAIVTDVRMPAMGGVELAERVRGLPNPPPLVFISGYGQHEVSPLHPFLSKPFHADDLADLVTRQLGGVGQQH